MKRRATNEHWAGRRFSVTKNKMPVLKWKCFAIGKKAVLLWHDKRTWRRQFRIRRNDKARLQFKRDNGSATAGAAQSFATTHLTDRPLSATCSRTTCTGHRRKTGNRQRGGVAHQRRDRGNISRCCRIQWCDIGHRGAYLQRICRRMPHQWA